MLKKIIQLFSHGSITELFSFYNMSSIFLVAYNEGHKVKLLSLGWFSVNRIIKATCPISATVCSVKGYQWPLTKDVVTIRMAKRTFAIALPGLLYNLQFPNLCPEVDINILERVFMRFCHYKNINDNGLGYPLEDNEPNLWNMLRHHIEPMVYETLMQLGQLPGLSRFRVPNHNSCSLRASRMSATTKLITDSMVHSGTLLPTTHISIKGTNPPDQVLHHDLAFASVSVFAYIVDAIELAWIMFFGLDHLVKDVEPPLRASSHDIGFKVWSLNKDGLMAFMHRLGPFDENGEVAIDAEFKGRQSKRQRIINSKFKDLECEFPKLYNWIHENEKGHE